MKKVLPSLFFLMALSVPLAVSELSAWPEEEVDVTEEGGTPLKVCVKFIPIDPVPRAKGHTTEPLPPPDNCGWDSRGVPYCCPKGILNK